MPVAAHLTTVLAGRPIVLWVEDPLTKACLERVWQPDDVLFNILVGGGASAIKGVVHDLRSDGYEFVFGLIDRDYNTPNVANWNNVAVPLEVFRPTAFEFENYLLNWDALEGCKENQSRYRRTRNWILTTALGAPTSPVRKSFASFAAKSLMREIPPQLTWTST